MSIFTDILAADLDNTFMNTGEFAETHNINGTAVRCTTDDPDISSQTPGAKRFDGTYKDSFTVFVREVDLSFRVAFNQVITFDNRQMRVVKAGPMNGLYELILEAIR